MKPSEINALIRELKKNREDMLPKCKLKIANRYDNLREALGDNDVDCLNPAGNHWDMGLAGSYAGVIYSLPPDYPEVPEVPEVTEGWVVVGVDSDAYIKATGIWRDWLSAPLGITGGLSHCITHFGGYLWESKTKPGRYILSCLLHGFDSDSGLSSVARQWVNPATPKALRFWSTDVAKACTLGFKPWNADEWPKV